MLPNLPEGTKLDYWCSFCNNELAEGEVTVEFNGQPVNLFIGSDCLTAAREAGKIEE